MSESDTMIQPFVNVKYNVVKTSNSCFRHLAWSCILAVTSDHNFNNKLPLVILLSARHLQSCSHVVQPVKLMGEQFRKCRAFS